MRSQKMISPQLLYGLAFLLALGLRLFKLGTGPLSDLEAGWALQAQGLAHGSSASLGAQPAYILLTSLLFSIIRNSNFLARLYPALVGSLIVWLPYSFRNWMGDSKHLQRAGLLMAFGMAIDPGLVALSRQVGSPVPAMVFTFLALACLYNRRMILAGILSGLALLSGAPFIQGLLILAICWGLFRLSGLYRVQNSPEDDAGETPASAFSPQSLAVSGFAFAGTLLVAGTLFLRVPQGLSALVETIPEYLNTWVKSSGIPLVRLPASLLVYQTLVVVFAIIAAVRLLFGDKEDHHTRPVILGLAILSLVAFLLPWLYAGRQVGDLAWALVPLWALAAFEISRSFLAEEDSLTRVIAGGLASFIFIMAVVGWINLLTIGRYQTDIRVYWLIIFGAFALGLIAILLVAAGFSLQAARLGVVWASCIVLGLLLFSFSWGMSIVRLNGAQELWSTSPTTGQAGNLSHTLSDLSSWNTGLKNQLDIVSLVDSPALRWELRNFPNATFASAVPPNQIPSVVITLKSTETPSLAQNYRGQDFIWRLYPGWQGAFPPDFINWLAFRTAPLAQEQIILWARADTFPGGTTGSSSTNLP